MDVRDLQLWIENAEVQGLKRQADAILAALLPHQEQRQIDHVIGGIRHRTWELQNEEKVEALEHSIEAAQERLAAAKAKMRARRRPKGKPGARPIGG